MRHRPGLLLIVVLAGCGSGGDDDGGLVVPCGATPADRTGEGTYYDADGSGNCSFDPSPGDLMVAAMNTPDYAGGAVCGACAEVDGPDGSVTVRIVDRCPECASGDLDLSREAFERIAPLTAGRVPITWRYVACDVGGPLRYRFKEGSNPYWTAIQVRNHRHAVATLEARGPGGAWRTIAREPYNYFVATDGLGDGPYDLRVTDVHGLTVEDTAVTPGDAVERTGAAQLPACAATGSARSIRGPDGAP